MSHEVETMYYTKDVPWHGLGVRVEEALASIDALKIAGLDWNVNQVPIYAGGEVQAALDDNETPVEVLTNFKNIPGRVANVRDSDGSILGVVSKNYRVVQNREAFSFTDALLGAGVKYETAGALFKGQRVWMLAKLRSTDILGDEVIPYLCFTNSHDGSTAVRVAITPVRVVCNNTLTMALDEAKRVWSTAHIGDMQAKLAEANNTLRLAGAYLEAMPIVAKQMAALNLYDDELRKFVEELFPVDPDLIESKIHVKHVEYLRQTLLNMHDTTTSLKPFYGTAWAYYNAVADMVTHMRPQRETMNYREKLFAKVIDGHPVLQKAQELLQKVKA